MDHGTGSGPWCRQSLRGDEGRRRRRAVNGLDEPVRLRQRLHGRQREMADGGAPAAHLLHGEQRGDGVAEDALPGDGQRLAPVEVPAGGGREDGLHRGLAVPDQLGDEVGGEEGLPQHPRDDGEAEHAAGALVELLEDLGEARVVDAAVVEQQHHLAVQVHHLAPDARQRGLGPARTPDALLELPLPDHELLLPLQEEGVELVDLGVQERQEVGLRGAGRRRIRRRPAGGHGIHAPLQLLVVEELAPPLRQALLDLLLEALAELHRSVMSRKIFFFFDLFDRDRSVSI
jgi:hypothetical protein|uniref:Uncharacterized protein n=1 Tax=Zea mays TaxID=4577 RepID=A0A804LLL4_MAIZE